MHHDVALLLIPTYVVQPFELAGYFVQHEVLVFSSPPLAVPWWVKVSMDQLDFRGSDALHPVLAAVSGQ